MPTVLLRVTYSLSGTELVISSLQGALYFMVNAAPAETQ